MKKIYFNIISLMMAAISFSSCSDWLDINPSDEIKEEFLFNNGDGFQTALNGIYRQMASFSLYGSNLMFGDRLKLMPRHCKVFVNAIQNKIKQRYGKNEIGRAHV